MRFADSVDRAANPSAAAFLARAALWTVGLFGLIRLAWVDRHLIGALIEFQKSVVFWYGAPPSAAIYVNSSCSGADVMALCAGVLLAYPAAWRRRIAGACIGVGMLLTLNMVRIASLYAVASSRDTLNLLHLYVWPAALTLATVSFVFLWIRGGEVQTAAASRSWRRFGIAASVSLAAYALVAPWAMTSRVLLQGGAWTASIAASVIGALGTTARATGNVLITPQGAFQVTQECLFTPMLPVYLAALFAAPISRRLRVAGLALALPLFFVLGLARLLVLALPPTVVESPVVVVHGFYQLLAGAIILVVAAHATAGGASALGASRRTLAALGVAIGAGVCAGGFWTAGLTTAAEVLRGVAPWTTATLRADADPQGALLLMPPYQLALVAGLWMAVTGGRQWRRLASALAALVVAQLAFLSLHGGLTAWLAIEPHALLVRAFAVAAPIALTLAATTTRGTIAGDRGYLRFWQDVGEEFPTLTGAASTEYYLASEQRLISEAVPSLEGQVVLKTDLWDEAKNTRILRWVADRGARVYGIDISEPIARQAREVCGRSTIRPVVSDVRRLPFGDASFDVIYSMGTIEHFAETEATVAELARLLRPGGRLILGVPNRHDPFLRPLMVAVLYRLGLYGYGYEKSYSRRALRRMIEDAGLNVELESGLLFIPGWLRMLDLWCHAYARPLAAVTGALVRPFAWIDRHVPAVRRHGYLLASVGAKPQPPVTADPPEGGAPPAAPERPVWHPPATTTAPAVASSSTTGTEYVVDARGCSAEALRSLPRLQQLFDAICADLRLRPVAPPVWHVFPGQGGITGIVLLSESHLTVHTYPEFGSAAINLYCCRPGRLDWPWAAELRVRLGADDVEIRTLQRG